MFESMSALDAMAITWLRQHHSTLSSAALAALPELGTLDPKALASLVGVAPFTQQSGAARGTAHIDGGRRHVRTGLWMPSRASGSLSTSRLVTAHNSSGMATRWRGGRSRR